jgi:hypothetical protein
MLRIRDCYGKAMPERPAQLSRYALALLTGMAACLLLALAWPRLQASVRYLPVDTALSAYRAGSDIDPAQLDPLAERAEAAIAAHGHHRYFDGLSELKLLAGGDMRRPYWQRRQRLEESLAAAGGAVHRAPARPRTWLRIARLRAALGYPADQVIEPWTMSVLTGRVEPTLMLTRLQLGFRYFGALGGEATGLLRDQLLLAWSVAPREVRSALEDGALDSGLVRQLLGDGDPGILAGGDPL